MNDVGTGWRPEKLVPVLDHASHESMLEQRRPAWGNTGLELKPVGGDKHTPQSVPYNHSAVDGYNLFVITWNRVRSI